MPAPSEAPDNPYRSSSEEMESQGGPNPLRVVTIAWDEGYAAGLAASGATEEPQEDGNTPPWAEGPCPETDRYLPSEAFVAGALSTQPPFRTYHPAYCLPLARIALDAFMAYEPDDGHRPHDPGARPAEPERDPECGGCDGLGWHFGVANFDTVRCDDCGGSGRATEEPSPRVRFEADGQ